MLKFFAKLSLANVRDGYWRATPDEDEHYIYAVAL
jgi:hypothetical protein